MDLPKPLEFEDIERARVDAGISQAALCRRAGRDTSTYTRWISGLFEPSASSLRSLHEALMSLIDEASDDAAQ